MEPGSKVGYRYQIIKRLGEGSSGSVYLATNTITDDRIAIKIAQTKDDVSVMQLQNESKILKILSKESNVAALRSFAVQSNLTYLVMDLALSSLQTILSQGNGLDDITRMHEAIIRGLSKLHELGLIHRDIKPANILLLQNNEWALSDYGLTGPPNQMGKRLNKIIGTPKYCSCRVSNLLEPGYADDWESFLYVCLEVSNSRKIKEDYDSKYSTSLMDWNTYPPEILAAIKYVRQCNNHRISMKYLKLLFDAYALRSSLIDFTI